MKPSTIDGNTEISMNLCVEIRKQGNITGKVKVTSTMNCSEIKITD